ncbi:MAG: hypothetical protein WA759_09110, partial [Pseudolabrys sp.]
APIAHRQVFGPIPGIVRGWTGNGANNSLTDPDNTHGVAGMAARGDVAATWDGFILHGTILWLLTQ